MNLGQPPDGLDPLARESVLTALRRGHTIEAIKIYRTATGAGLRESKNAIEAMRSQSGPDPAKPAGGGGPPGSLLTTIVVAVIVSAITTFVVLSLVRGVPR